MPRDVAADFAALLEAAGLGWNTTAGNLFIGRMPATPDECVAVMEMPGGDVPAPYILGGSRSVYLRAQVSVRVRGAPEAYAATKAKALQLYAALNLAQLEPYVQIRCRDSVPFEGPPDANARPQWNVDVVAEWRDDGTYTP